MPPPCRDQDATEILGNGKDTRQKIRMKKSRDWFSFLELLRTNPDEWKKLNKKTKHLWWPGHKIQTMELWHCLWSRPGDLGHQPSCFMQASTGSFSLSHPYLSPLRTVHTCPVLLAGANKYRGQNTNTHRNKDHVERNAPLPIPATE